MKIKSKYIFVIGAIFVVFLMVSSATAVPYTRQEPFRFKMNEIKGKLNGHRDNSLFNKLESLIKERKDVDREESIIETFQNFLDNFYSVNKNPKSGNPITNIVNSLLELIQSENEGPEKEELVNDIEKNLLELLSNEDDPPKKKVITSDMVQMLLDLLSKENVDSDRNKLVECFFQQLLKLFSEEIDDPKQEELVSDIEGRLLELKNIDINKNDYSDYIHVLLLMIVDFILLLFGQNIIGQILALLIIAIIAIPYSLLLGIVTTVGFLAEWGEFGVAAVSTFFGLMVVYALLIEFFNPGFWDEFFDTIWSAFWHTLGLIFGGIVILTSLIFVIISIGIYSLIGIVLIPFAYIGSIFALYISAILEVLMYLSSLNTVTI